MAVDQNGKDGDDTQADGRRSEERHFGTDHLIGDLTGRSVRGGATTVVGQTAKLMLQIGSIAILARLLTPADFGLFAMVTVVTGFIGLFSDLGLSTATLQRKEITHAEVTALFWLNVLLGVVCMLVAIALAPAIAAFYDEQRLFEVTLAISATFVISGFAAQHLALIRRQMRYRTLVTIEITSAAAGIAVALPLAWAGAAHWALVGMAATSPATTLVLAWRSSRWRPSRPKHTSGLWSIVAFGGNLSLFNTTNYFSRVADSALIGWRWGPGELGIYDRAYSLLMLPLRQINVPLASVVVPALSRLQDTPDRYRRYYCRVANLVVYATVPLLALLGVLSSQVIHIVLGSQWSAASAIFTFLAIAAIGQPLLWTFGWVHISLGRAHRLRNWGFVTDPLCVISFAIGLPWGGIGVAISYAVYVNLIVLPGMLYALHGSPIEMRDLLKSVWCPFLLSGTVLAGAWSGREFAAAGSGDWVIVFYTMLGWFAAFPVFYALVPQCRTEVAALISLLKHFKGDAK